VDGFSEVARGTTVKCKKVLGAFANLLKATVTFVMSARPPARTPLPLNEFSLNLLFDYISKICGEKSDKNKGRFT
jgi:hypothetical protein